MIIQDQINRELSITNNPQRIVSLVPSITYTLSDFGLNKEVKGITRFDKFLPYSKKEKIIIGGTKDVKIDRIKDINPDIILANKEENTKEIVETLEKIAPVFVSDIKNYTDNSDFIKKIGTIFQKQELAHKYIQDIENLRNQLQQPNQEPVRAIYLIWKKPWMTVGGDTFINEVMKIGGFENLYQNQKRYPETSIKEMQELHPEIILLSSEPYPFKEKEQKELQSLFPNTQIKLVEGEAFTWFGTYPLKGFEYLLKLKQKSNA